LRSLSVPKGHHRFSRTLGRSPPPSTPSRTRCDASERIMAEIDRHRPPPTMRIIPRADRYPALSQARRVGRFSDAERVGLRRKDPGSYTREKRRVKRLEGIAIGDVKIPTPRPRTWTGVGSGPPARARGRARRWGRAGMRSESPLILNECNGLWLYPQNFGGFEKKGLFQHPRLLSTVVGKRQGTRPDFSPLL